MPIRNDDIFDAILRSDMTDVVNEIVDEVLKEMQDSMIRTIYEPWNPSYQRLFDQGGLFDSYIKVNAVGKEALKRFEIEGSVDQDPMRMENRPEYFIHGSFYYQTDDVRDFLTKMVIEGTSGPLFGDGFWTEPRDFYEPVLNWLNKEFDSKVKNKMRIRGMNVV